MKIKPFTISITTLVLSMLACNLGKIAPSDSPTFDPNSEVTESTPAPVNEAADPPVSAGVCDNPYLPIIQGATWNYNLTGPSPDTYIHSILSLEADGFTEQDVFGSGVTRQDNGNARTET